MIEAHQKVTLDRSRDFATVHGDRAPDDTHATVRFYQDELPFDAHGVLIEGHSDIENNDKLKALVERKRKKVAASAAKATQRTEGGDDEEDDDDKGDVAGDDGKLPPVELRKWIMGQKEYPWNDVSQEIANKYKVRVGGKKHAVELLVGEGLVTRELVAKEYQKYLD